MISRYLLLYYRAPVYFFVQVMFNIRGIIMRSITRLLIVLLVAASSTLAMANREVDTKDFSGWMKDYDSLTYNEERNAFLFFNEDKRGAYNKILLDKVVIYSENREPAGEIAEEAASAASESGISSLEAEIRDMIT